MKKIALTSLLAIIFIHENANPQSMYKVLSTSELRKIEEAKKIMIDTSYIIQYNGAFVTIFKDGTSMLMPPVLGGEEGIFFYNLADMNEMVESRKYPVKGSGSFWEKERGRTLEFQKSILYYCLKMTEILNYNVELSNDSLYLKELSNIVNNKLRSKKYDKNLCNYLSIYIGELIREKVNGEWKLLPQQALNIYYLPEITKGDKFCSHWSFINNQLGLASFIPVDIESLIEKANVFYPIGNRQYVAR